MDFMLSKTLDTEVHVIMSNVIAFSPVKKN